MPHVEVVTAACMSLTPPSVSRGGESLSQDLGVQGNSAELLRGSSHSLETDWEGSLLEGVCTHLKRVTLCLFVVHVVTLCVQCICSLTAKNPPAASI